MKKRLASGLAVFLVLGLAVVWLVPGLRYGLLRHVSKGPYYEDRPVSYWIDTLDSADAGIRHHAIYVFGQTGGSDPAVVPALVAVVKHPDYVLRKNAIAALAELGPAARPATPELVEALKDSNQVVRREAANALGRVDPDPAVAVPALVAALKDGDGWVRVRAMTSLQHLGPAAKAAIPALLEILKEPGGRDGNTGMLAVATLQHIGPEAVLPHFVAALSSPNAQTRANAVQGLGGMPEHAKPALPAMIKLLKDPEGPVRLAAAGAVWKVDPQQVGAVVPVLTELLQDQKSWSNRGIAAGLLADIGPGAKAAVPALIETLKDRHEDIRRLAVDALARIGPDAKEAVPALTAALEDEEVQVRTQAARALERIRAEKTVGPGQP